MMRPDVGPEIRRRYELPLAYGAGVWLDTGVRENVTLQVPGCSEGFGAFVALVRFFSGVNAHVSSQVG